MPRWTAAASPPDDPTGHLILLPPTAEPLLPDDWLTHAEHLGASLIRGQSRRPEMIAAALALLGAPPEIEADLVADFLALGYAFYVIETITVSIRYMNSLDESAFEQEVLAAAAAACRGDGDGARAKLQAAFDLLHTAREYYYSSESHLLDLTLVASTTLGAALRSQLTGSGIAGDAPCNLLLSAEVLEEMAVREPATLDALRHALAQGTAGIVGGEFRELELPLLGPEAIRRQLEKGLAVYLRHLDRRPTVFGRRRFGMTPFLPQILDYLGFTGVLHATLDDGRFPVGNTSRLRWEGIDGTTVESLLRVPIDAARAEGFLRLPHALSGVTDMDNQPTMIFAHWPGSTSPWYEDIHRARRYTAVLGSFRTLPDYIEQTGMSGHQIVLKADEYRAPYLKQAVAAGQVDPISRWVAYSARRAAAESAQTIAAMATLACGKAAVCVNELLDDIDSSLTPAKDSAVLDDRVRQVTGFAAANFVEAIGGVRQAFQPDLLASQAGNPDVPPAGLLFINPLSVSRRVFADVTDLDSLPEVAGAVLRSQEEAGRKSIVVEIPPLGFAFAGPGGDPEAVKPAPRRFGLFPFRKAPRQRPMAELVTPGGGAIMRNEFFELTIDPHTGAIRSIFDFHSRGPRLAQQIAMRFPGTEEEVAYSIMAADEISVLASGPARGEVLVRGRLLDRGGQLMAGFRQTTRVTWGSRVIDVEVELDPQRLPEGDPWSSYYAARFAWSDDAPTLYRGLNQATLATEATHLESPSFVEIRGNAGRTTILTAGLPYHRRQGLRMLDTLLLVRGETARRFRFGIGIDLQHPMAAALDFISPTPKALLAAGPKNNSGWLFHLDSRAVIATHWDAILTSGVVAGFRVRLLETEGRQGSLGLRSFRTIASAQKAGGADRPPIDLTVEGDRVTVPMRPYEWAEVEGRFE
jgi:alpha-mannosidase